ncbi:hypothetical protein PVAND_004816 [Polypedilum vanderplanki]|uniref:Uncharacterized protein n=1 Tax=Polypedilum vanderplanki TaxID=319348 RepID=A0A9J6BYD5_POLVA|nr:hypothetical protein PVAND_004816 [Polypedilum vanderplanki]
MFLKSITLHGFMSVRESKTTSFEYHKKSTRTNDNIFINYLNDIEFISAFSFIFDPHHESNKNCQKFIHPRAKGDSFVEIHFWRSREEISENYDWLCRKELTLKRTLQNPKNIHINRKKYSTKSFHDSLLQLGFQSINKLLLHRLMDLEIDKLSSFNGEDFWNIIMKIIECEELIEMAERKEGVVKKEILKEKYNEVANIITKQLPKKFQLRDEIRERIKINRHFFTLYYILTERRTQVFERLKKFYSEEQNRVLPSVRNLLMEQLNTQKRINLEEMISERSHLKALEELIDDLSLVSDNYNIESIPISQFFELINSCNFGSEKVINHSSLIASWKIFLKNAKENGNLELEIENLKPFLRNASYLDVFNEFEEESFEVDFTSVQINEVEAAKNKMKLASTMIELRKKFFQIISEVQTLTIQGCFDQMLPCTLFEIEKIIQNDSTLKEDFIGPVFKFFNKNTKSFDSAFWHNIEEIANIILFRKTTTAHTFIEQFKLKAIKNSGDPLKILPDYKFKICCIDDIVEKSYDDDIHNNESLRSMKDLISKETPSSIRKIMKTLLHEFLIIQDEDYEPNESCKNFKIIEINNEKVVKTHFRNSTRIVTNSNIVWDELERSPIDVIQEIYEKVLQQVKVSLEIDKIENLQNEMRMMSKQERKDAIKNFSKRIFNIKEKRKFPNEFGILTQIIDDPNLSQKIDEWSLHELEMQVNESTFNLFVNNKIDDFVEGVKEDVALKLLTGCNYFTFGSNKKSEIVINTKLTELKNILSNNEPEHLHLNQIERSAEFMVNYRENPKECCDIFLKYGKFQMKKSEMQNLIEELIATLVIAHDPKTSPMFFHQEIYNDNVDKNIDELINDIKELRQQLINLNEERTIELRRLSLVEYKKLVDSIGNVQRYAEQEDFSPLQVKRRAYPLMNIIVVKILKDTIGNFTTTYNHVLSDYINDSELFFFTNPKQGINGGNFSWNCLDLSQLKAIEFAESWKNDKMKNSLESAVRQKIKGLLLILYIINYISAFKFLILSDKVFENFDDGLKEKFYDILKAISPYVQIIIFKNDNQDESIQVPNPQIEESPEEMDVDYNIDDISVIS